MPAKQENSHKFFPTSLTTYEQCPERYYHKYVEKRPEPDDFFIPAWERGRAVHVVLKDVATLLMRQEPIPTNIRERAAIALKRWKYPSEGDWLRDLEIVIRDVEFGLSQFDDGARVLAAEQKYARGYQQTPENPYFALEARVDLILHRVDEDGLPFIDVVDFKSGRGTVYPVQEYVCRSVVEFHAHWYCLPFNYFRSTTVRTSLEQIDSWIIEGDEHAYLSQHVTKLVKDIYSEYNEPRWRPVESWRCRWCPYRDDGCSLAPAINSSAEFGDELDRVER